jgi:hypothetical protein
MRGVTASRGVVAAAIYWGGGRRVLDANLTWQIRARWTRALEARLADPNLPAIPEIAQRLPEPPRRIRTGEHPVLDQIAGEVGKAGKSDPRAWVQKILERKARNDPTLSDYAWRMALAAKR